MKTRNKGGYQRRGAKNCMEDNMKDKWRWSKTEYSIKEAYSSITNGLISGDIKVKAFVMASGHTCL